MKLGVRAFTLERSAARFEEKRGVRLGRRKGEKEETKG
jgi:hypothetical protein